MSNWIWCSGSVSVASSPLCLAQVPCCYYCVQQKQWLFTINTSNFYPRSFEAVRCFCSITVVNYGLEIAITVSISELFGASLFGQRWATLGWAARPAGQASFAQLVRAWPAWFGDFRQQSQPCRSGPAGPAEPAGPASSVRPLSRKQ